MSKNSAIRTVGFTLDHHSPPLINPNKLPFIWVHSATYNGFTKAIGSGYKNHIFEATFRVKGKPKEQFFQWRSEVLVGTGWVFFGCVAEVLSLFFVERIDFCCSISLQVGIRSLYVRLSLCTRVVVHLVYWGKIQDSYILTYLDLGNPKKVTFRFLWGLVVGNV